MTRNERLEQRARDAVAECLIHHLQVPQIYFEAEWGVEGKQIDILAIDKAGAGDVHVVEIKAGTVNPRSVVNRLMNIPAQYRWMVVFRKPGQKADPAGKAPSYLYPIEEMGRIGVIEVVRMAGDSLGANIRFKAERFRGNYTPQVDEFVKKHRPDIEFR